MLGINIGYIDTPEEWRDIFIMAFCAAGIITFLVILFASLVSGWLSFNILNRIRHILKDNVQPTTENIRDTATNLKGAVSYISDTAVKPVVTVYGVAAGAKRFVGVVTRVTRKKEDS